METQRPHKILVIGDSHSNFWGGADKIDPVSHLFSGVDILWLGAVTAYGAIDPNSSTQALNLTIAHLDKHHQDYGCILLSFGEIDCRVHLVKQAIIQALPIEEVVQNTIARYHAYAINITSRYNIPCIFWGPIASSPPDKFEYNPLFPTFGTVAQRNWATYTFNKALSGIAKTSRNLGYISIFEDMITPEFSTRAEYLFDGCHLSKSHIFTVKALLKNELSRIGLSDLSSALELRSYLQPNPIVCNVAIDMTYETSSQWCDYAPNPFDESPTKNFYFHTNNDVEPYALFDLGEAHIIDSVLARNRLDMARPMKFLKCLVSTERGKYRRLGKRRRKKLDNAQDIDIFSGDEKPVRFVMLSLGRPGYLHLSHVEINIRTYIPV